ncbi:MAG: DUF1177 domain-containing protein [Hyphomicrobiales bacterium]|nr:DUF1177 domain-containing protein [Hyphomicrobiales bacterium]
MLKQVIDLFELLDRPDANAAAVAGYLAETGTCEVTTQRLSGAKGGGTDCIKVRIPGSAGRAAGGSSPTLGIIGRLGGLGARPEVIGFVSDGDGALTALAAAAKLARMHALGDVLPGDVVVTTHICPDAPTRPHKPVPFMGSHVTQDQINAVEVLPEMEAILSIDTTKGNRIINHRGFAISPTVRQGYILKVSDDLLDVMARVTGRLPQVFALSQQDITPYGNDLHHLNSILQPATVTAAPVVGVALVTEVPVAGCASGASHPTDVEAAARFAVEVAKAFTAGDCAFHDGEEFDRMVAQYGDMTRFQVKGGRA